MPQRSVTDDEALSTAVDLLVGATETVRHDDTAISDGRRSAIHRCRPISRRHRNGKLQFSHCFVILDCWYFSAYETNSWHKFTTTLYESWHLYADFQSIKISVLKLTEIVILWVYITPSRLALVWFGTFGA